MSQMTPREIVEELDKHIVGQKAAKRAVAIALRNRWRRQQLPEDIRKAVTPKNIILKEINQVPKVKALDIETIWVNSLSKTRRYD